MTTKLLRSFALAAVAMTSLTASLALAQSAPAHPLDEDLQSISRTFGGSDGSIAMTSDAGEVFYLAYGASSFTKYVAGSFVASTDRLMLCRQGSTGQLHSCTPLEPWLDSNGGGGTGYWCGPDPDNNGDTYCDCKIGLDCLQMLADGACEDPIICDDDGCSCDF